MKNGIKIIVSTLVVASSLNAAYDSFESKIIAVGVHDNSCRVKLQDIRDTGCGGSNDQKVFISHEHTNGSSACDIATAAFLSGKTVLLKTNGCLSTSEGYFAKFYLIEMK